MTIHCLVFTAPARTVEAGKVVGSHQPIGLPMNAFQQVTSRNNQPAANPTDRRGGRPYPFRERTLRYAPKAKEVIELHKAYILRFS